MLIYSICFLFLSFVPDNTLCTCAHLWLSVSRLVIGYILNSNWSIIDLSLQSLIYSVTNILSLTTFTTLSHFSFTDYQIWNLARYKWRNTSGSNVQTHALTHCAYCIWSRLKWKMKTLPLDLLQFRVALLSIIFQAKMVVNILFQPSNMMGSVLYLIVNSMCRVKKSAD